MIEVVGERRHPFECPSHSLFVGLDFGEGCPRHDNERHVALGQVNHRTVEMIGEE